MVKGLGKNSSRKNTEWFSMWMLADPGQVKVRRAWEQPQEWSRRDESTQGLAVVSVCNMAQPEAPE